ncbi:hypothetical protein [Micromonospora haikouensis]|uniref:hypothetical protein n=1 Tax=Micromonospora haikouensis TaxID=686309 RepID=UPI003D73171B
MDHRAAGSPRRNTFVMAKTLSLFDLTVQTFCPTTANFRLEARKVPTVVALGGVRVAGAGSAVEQSKMWPSTRWSGSLPGLPWSPVRSRASPVSASAALDRLAGHNEICFVMA